jgi:branched-chain amino acid transport system ATP-binding protein
MKEDQLLKEKAAAFWLSWVIALSRHFALRPSYGIIKKIELARTLMCDPELIILDEPATGSTIWRRRIAASSTNRDEYKTTIFLVEHDMPLVMGICDTSGPSISAN